MNGDDSPCSQADPLGLARLWKQRVSETKTSTENTRVATTGSNRGAAEPACESAAEPAKEAAHKEDKRSVHGSLESESLLCDVTAVPTALQVPIEQPAVDRAGEGAASLAGPGDSRPEPLLSDGNAAGAALQPDLPDAGTQADPRALPLLWFHLHQPGIASLLHWLDLVREMILGKLQSFSQTHLVHLSLGH